MATENSTRTRNFKGSTFLAPIPEYGCELSFRKEGRELSFEIYCLKWQQNIQLRGGTFTFSKVWKPLITNTRRTGSIAPQLQAHTKDIPSGCSAFAQGASTPSTFLPFPFVFIHSSFPRKALPDSPFLISALLSQCLSSFPGLLQTELLEGWGSLHLDPCVVSEAISDPRKISVDRLIPFVAQVNNSPVTVFS